MATSGTNNYIVNRDEIITEALELLAVLGEGETPTSDQITSSARTLNMMIKNWQAEGLNLFAVRKLYLFLEKGKKEYRLGGSSGSHLTELFDTHSLLDPAEEGDESIYVGDETAFDSGDTVGILVEGKIYWNTVHWAEGNVGLTEPLPVDAPEGSTVFRYRTKSSRPMLVLESYLHLSGSHTDVPVGVISRRKYNELSVKNSFGFVNQVYYDPQIGEGSLFVWPTATTEGDQLILFVQRTLDDVNSAEDNFDIPQEWYMPLAYSLAMHLAPKYGTPPSDYSRIERQAVALYERAKEFDEELYTSVYFEPDFYGREV